MTETIQPAAILMDRINRDAWRTPDSVQWFAKLEGWTDAGERAALERIAAETTGLPILDLGVGGGRTVPLLRAISSDYIAIDYTPELVAACKERFPDVDVRCGDARDLSAFADQSFALVVFSFNGIDAVNPDDRMRILREAHRVLRKDGVLLFSTHNKLGPCHGERFQLGVYPTRNPFKLAWRLIRALARSLRTIANYRRYSRLNLRAEGYSIMNAAAHNHGILIHYITLERQCEQLAAVGFRPDPEIYGDLGEQFTSQRGDTSRTAWFHFLARKS
ncbi:class I SAM-dependent methyltransferase [Nevskia soli]|uniref:class I SAM-dependent methyltransferase n=1 Tax=Nevskia soli TaxID=418856 RepID=UPI0004A71566|nr:class I SAM-dependent methyltransferase [Nevskia soli]